MFSKVGYNSMMCTLHCTLEEEMFGFYVVFILCMCGGDGRGRGRREISFGKAIDCDTGYNNSIFPCARARMCYAWRRQPERESMFLFEFECEKNSSHSGCHILLLIFYYERVSVFFGRLLHVYRYFMAFLLLHLAQHAFIDFISNMLEWKEIM